MKKISILLLLLFGCVGPGEYTVDYDLSMQAALDAWEEVIGPVSQKCIDEASSATVIEAGYFPESCIPWWGSYVGCEIPIQLIDGDDVIYILESRTDAQKARTAVHEYIHLLGACELRQPDPNHEIKYLWDDYGHETVEYVGKRKLVK